MSRVSTTENRPMPTIFHGREEAELGTLILDAKPSEESTRQYSLSSCSIAHIQKNLSVDDLFKLCRELSLPEKEVSKWIMMVDWHNQSKKFPMTLKDWNSGVYQAAHCMAKDLIDLPEFIMSFKENANVDALAVNEKNSTEHIIVKSKSISRLDFSAERVEIHIALIISDFIASKTRGMTQIETLTAVNSNIFARQLSEHLSQLGVPNNLITVLEKESEQNTKTKAAVCIKDVVVKLPEKIGKIGRIEYESRHTYLSRFNVLISDKSYCSQNSR